MKKEELVKPEKLIDKARDAYGSMQRSWWEFAKVVSEIKEKEAYIPMGYHNFKEFCEKEYSSLSYSVIHKFTMIVERWYDAIEGRISKDAEYQLPSYESCYIVGAIKEDAAPKEEISKLRKAILDNKITQQALRDRLKEIIAKKRHEAIDPVITEDYEKSLVEDLADDEELQRQMDDLDDSDDETDFLDEPEESEDDDFEIDEDDSESEDPASGLRNRVAYLLDNLPAFQSTLKKGKISDETIELAEELQRLEKVIGKFLDKMENV
jgi:hypothetical protein